jgi:putative intracellular protease/amidase
MRSAELLSTAFGLLQVSINAALASVAANDFYLSNEQLTKGQIRMKRRCFLAKAAAFSAAIAAAPSARVLLGAEDAKKNDSKGSAVPNRKLTPPAKGRIPVAVVISEGVTVIDFAGPWEVFQDVMIAEQMPFQLFTVSDKIETITATAGLKLVPDYTFANVPECQVVVIPAQRGSEPMREWLRKVSQTADVTMSVCTGAFQLAKAGLLAGKCATTHHEFLDRLEKDFPDVKVARGVRFVEGERISTAGGLSSGIDLALRVVERYFGRKVAETTATYMEYQGTGWLT